MTEQGGRGQAGRAGLAIGSLGMVAAVAVGLLTALWSAPTRPVEAAGERGAESVDFVEITPETDAAIERGLKWLVASQAEDGSFDETRYGKHAGITALGCIALMADGNLPDRGRYADELRKGLEFTLSSVQETGLIAAQVSHGPMYGHGFATLFLGEIYGTTREPRIRDALAKAVRLIAATQNDEGGWRYQPAPTDADISVTICQIMALRSARNAGLSVPKQTIDKAIEYVKGCQNEDGGFRYMLRGGSSAFPRSAAGLASLYYAGIYEGEAVEEALAYLRKHAPSGGRGGHYYYGQYYAVQAMYLAGGEHWAFWYPKIREELIKSQQPDGSWTDGAGDAYATAMALIVLQVPKRMLPIFQR